ncbi:MAG: hypothetical protein ND866_13520, partial [Pyrinomonadaceae bacterium]|nr:hypothetical protein [Pyrinomonadaceae bacterium]
MKETKKSKLRINTSQSLRQSGRLRTRLVAAAIGCLLIAGTLYAISRSKTQNATASNKVEAAHCDAGISSAREAHHGQPIEPIHASGADAAAIAPPSINSAAAPASAPEGMVWIPGGE